MALSETLSVCDARRQWLSHRHFGQHQTARAIVHEQEGAWHMLGGEEPGSKMFGLPEMPTLGTGAPVPP